MHIGFASVRLRFSMHLMGPPASKRDRNLGVWACTMTDDSLEAQGKSVMDRALTCVSSKKSTVCAGCGALQRG